MRICMTETNWWIGSVVGILLWCICLLLYMVRLAGVYLLLLLLQWWSHGVWMLVLELIAMCSRLLVLH